MKAGKSLIELATEVQRQASQKRDFVVPAKSIVMRDDKRFEIAQSSDFTGLNEGLDFNDYAHGQVADYLKIPRKYYDKMLQDQKAGSLLQNNVNHWFGQSNGNKRMIRVLDNRGRAFLSSRYRILDNGPMLERYCQY